jgi:uridine kinase
MSVAGNKPLSKIALAKTTIISILRVMPGKKPFIIGLAGPSCSGKSLLAAAIKNAFQHGPVSIIDMDSYYADLSHLSFEQREQRNFDHPKAFDTALLFHHMELLKAGQKINMPVYDFKIHCRKNEVTEISPGSIIIVDGIFALYFKILREAYRLKIYLDIDEPTMLRRRIDRDFRERARTEESVRRQFRASVRFMNLKYIVPSSKYADIVLDGNEPVENNKQKIMAAVTPKLI